MTNPLLAARGLSKSFGQNEVLKGIDFEIHGGRNMALCGENGAGKSTLIKLLTGLYSPSSGHVEYEGSKATWSDSRQSLEAGIAVVHQEFSTIGALSIAENIYLGSEPKTALGLIDRTALRLNTDRLLSNLGIALRPDDLVETLSVADKQMVEIAKVLRSDAKILIFDEPTAVLSQKETRHLFRIVTGLREKGLGLVYVSHRLDEIFKICTDVTVIKDGSVISSGPISSFSQDSIITAMVGRDLEDLFPPKAVQTGEKVLEVHNLLVDQGLPPVSLTVNAGEIVGLAGLVGAGRTELALAIYGATQSTGDVRLLGNPLPRRTPADSIDAGILMLTESRKDDGLFLNTSVARNFTATSAGKGTHHSAISPGHEERRAGVLKQHYGVVVDHVGMAISTLSGGNQQKVLIARLLENHPKLLLLDEPTRGVDVGAKAEIYKTLRQLADEGLALLVISSELIEIVGLCDRVLVMRDRQIVSELTGDDISEEQIITVAAAETTMHQGVAS